MILNPKNLKPILLGAKSILQFYNYRDNIKLHIPDLVDLDKSHSNLEIVARIFESYKKMKAAQKNEDKLYQPSSFWQTIIDNAYSPLNIGIENNEIETFQYFLENFGSWDKSTGIKSMLFQGRKKPFRNAYLRNVIFGNQLKTWKWFTNNQRDISSLTYPRFGNQIGAYINNNFVGAGSFFNEIYGCQMSNILKGKERPTIGELGGGYGKLAYFILRNLQDYSYIDFDLPEILALGAYYLMSTFPDKKTLLYGEEDFTEDSIYKYDLTFMPSFEIGKLKERSINLFINQNSLGEMHAKASKNYINKITRNTKNYFFHMNHESFPESFSDGTRALKNGEYPIDDANFRQIIRYPDLGHHLYLDGRKLNLEQDIFFYLYERYSD